LMMVLFGTAGLARSLAELLYPSPRSEAPLVTAVAPRETGYDPDLWERQQEVQRAADRRSSILNLVGQLALVLVAGPLYRYHWRRAEAPPEDPGRSPMSGEGAE